jgi:hypothetical protein
MTAKVQFQDKAGNWLTVTVVHTVTDASIKRALDTAEKTYKSRVRAVDSAGNILDLRDLK